MSGLQAATLTFLDAVEMLARNARAYGEEELASTLEGLRTRALHPNTPEIVGRSEKRSDESREAKARGYCGDLRFAVRDLARLVGCVVDSPRAQEDARSGSFLPRALRPGLSGGLFSRPIEQV